MLARFHFTVYVNGNFCKEDALKLTDMIELTLKACHLPSAQWPILRSLIFPPGSNYVYDKTLKDPDNINNCLGYWLYFGDRDNLPLRAKALLFGQIAHEPAFN